MNHLFRLILLIAGICVASPAMAQTSAPEAMTSGMTMMLVAYAVLWILVGGYLLILGRRQTRLSKEIKELRGAIDKELGLDETLHESL